MKQSWISVIFLCFLSNGASSEVRERIHPSLLKLPKPIYSSAFNHSGDKAPEPAYQDSLIPLGFGPHGTFAYIRNSIDGGCGHCPQLGLVDLIRDRNIESPPSWDFGLDWVRSSTTSTTFLFEHGIEALGDQELTRFPAAIETDRYDASIKNDQLVLTSQLRGAKVVTNLKQKIDADRKIGDWYIEGFLTSPFEKRIAIILSHLSLGFEGETDETFFVFGANLEKGFHLPNPALQPTPPTGGAAAR